MNRHIEWDTLNEYVDGALPRDEHQRVAGHISVCASCERQHADLHSMLARLSGAARTDAPDAVWTEVRASISPSSPSHVPAVHRWNAARARTVHLSIGRLAAAALVLVAVSVGATSLLMQTGDMPAGVAATDPAPSLDNSAPVQLTSTDYRYIETVDELEAQLEVHRRLLRPETIAMVERSLRTIDTALAEARSALLADPANDALRDVLESTYRHKVDFLKRATQIASAE